jgi:hypothetical protein
MLGSTPTRGRIPTCCGARGRRRSQPAGSTSRFRGVPSSTAARRRPTPPFHVSGAATLRLTSTATPETLTVSPAEFVIDGPGGQGVDVLLSSPATKPLPISAASQKGLVFTSGNGGRTIPVGSNKGGFVIQAETGGTDFVTVSVDGFQPATVTVHVRPVLSEVQPTAGSPNIDVTLVGKGFAAGADTVAVIGNNSRSATFVDSEHLTTRFAGFGVGPISVAVARPTARRARRA